MRITLTWLRLEARRRWRSLIVLALLGRSPLASVNVDGPGTKGGVLASPALFRRYRANIMGTSGQTYINAFVRLKGGEAAIAAFRADLARRQSRLVILTRATLLAVIGLAFGIPLGIALGRTLWRAATGMLPLAYQPPLAPWALLLIAPLALVAANLLAAWPARRAARLRPAQILRTE